MLIVRAAIMFANGEVIEGHDYGYINIVAHKLGYVGQKVHGFTTSSGEFVLPIDATDIAIKANQFTADSGLLKPEDLWPSTEL